jgi:hypothetical protein
VTTIVVPWAQHSERAVAFDSPERIIDAFEVVDVRHQQRDGQLPMLNTLDFAVRTRLEVATIEDASCRVDRRRAP